jgi:dimethylaniline monooxygenase (N-oxide forming)
VRRQRVAIIGAGASGVVTAKTLLQQGLDVTVYEAGSSIGGLWVYENDNGTPVAYKNLYILTPKRYTQWRDFPMDDATPEYARHTDMARYFQQYADFFGITPHIRFKDRVLDVKPAGSEWQVTSEKGTRDYDAVVVATGHFHRPRWPQGLKAFTGEVLHSSQYREPIQANNKRVLVIGLGNSACDVAADVSWVAEKTVVSARTPVFSGPRWLFGHAALDIFHRFQGPRSPKRALGKLSKTLVRLYWGDLSRWGIREPSKGAHGVAHEFLLPILKYGRIVLRPDITAIDGQTISFSDGTSEDFDLVIAATGYELDFPFLGDLIRLNPERSELDNIYLRVFSADHPGLAFVGLSNNNGVANTPTFERQAELLADVLAGRGGLPDDDAMRQAVRERREKTQALFLNTPRHAMEEGHPDYVIELVHERIERGAQPNGTGGERTDRFGKRCWSCGVEVAEPQARTGHATDWGLLRQRPNTYTKPVKLCPPCHEKTRRMRRTTVGAAAAATGAVGLVAVAGVSAVVGAIRGQLP